MKASTWMLLAWWTVAVTWPSNSSAAEPTTELAWQKLFDGRTFQGWEGDTEKTWRVEERSLVAGSLDVTVPRNEFLATTAEFGDFELRLKWKLTGSEGFINGGVQFRSRRIPNHHEMIGYQADIGTGWDGALYDESRRKRILAQPAPEVVAKTVKKGDWNEYRIRAEGPRIQLWINGIQTVDYTEKDPAIPRKGMIAMQIHGGGKAIVRYRDIEILTQPSRIAPAVSRFEDRSKPGPPRGPFPGRRFTLESNDVVVFMGQTDIVRARQEGTLEASLARQFAPARPRFRNMAWEGDTVYEQWRDLNFGSWTDQLVSIGATVAFAQFGQMESLEGPARIDAFIAAYEKLLDRVAARTARIVLISPRPFEKPKSRHMPDHTAQNDVVERYVGAIEDLAKRRGFVFVDLFHDDSRGRLSPIPHLTTNGIHLTPEGQRVVARRIAEQLGATAIIDDSVQPLRRAIVAKNQLWFDNWRTRNWAFAFGDRTEQQFGKAGGQRPPLRIELEDFKPLLRQADARIHRLAMGDLEDRSTIVKKPETPSTAGDPATVTAEPPDHSVEAELRSFRLTDGFDVQLFASEADGVVKPLQMRWDDLGRLWVLCAPTYPHVEPGAAPRDYILICEDTNGDGRADRFSRFAEGLYIPMGIEFGAGGVYVSEGTELVLLRDTDGDGRADSRTVILSGFGTADSHQTINSLQWGPGGELWFGQGHHAYSRVETPWGISKLDKGGVWRYRPRTGRLDSFFNLSTAGLNCQGTVADDWGQIFHNSAAHSGGFYTVAGMIPTLRPVPYWALAIPDRRNTGIEIVGTRHLPDDLQGCMIWSGFMANSVQVHRLVEEGSGFNAQVLPDLLTSDRTEFRPVNVRIGPDGAIYVCDWYNAVIGHYQASYRDPNRDKSHGRIWRITAKGRPLVKQPSFATLTPRELLEQLRSPERLTRQLAKRRLFDLPTDQAIAATDAWLAGLDSNDPQYSHLLFEAIGVYEAHEEVRPNLLRKLLDSEDYRVRAYGTRVIGNWADRLSEPLAWLRERVRDEHPRVRLEAIAACSYVQSPKAVEVATEVLDLPTDRFLSYALSQSINALKPFWSPALSRGELRFDNHVERLRFVLESDGTKDVAGLVRQLAGNTGLDAEARSRLLALLAHVGTPNDLRFAWDEGGQSPIVLDELAMVASLHGRRPSGDLVEPLRTLLGSTDEGLRAAAIRLAGAWDLKQLVEDVRRELKRDDAPEVVTRAALGAIARLEGPNALALIEPFGTARRSHAVQCAAIAAMTSFDRERAAVLAARLMPAVTEESEMAELLAPILDHRGGGDALARDLASSRLAADPAILAHRVLSGAGRREDALLDELNRAIGIRGGRPEYDADFVKTLARRAVAEGDPVRGREVFLSKLANCTACHKVGNQGGDIGPDLSIVGAGRSPELLAESILWPNRQVREGFMSTKILTDSGQVFLGYKLRETDDEIQLRDTTANRVRRIAKSSIEEMADAGSVMPEGLTSGMTRDELRDLVRYLRDLGRK